MNPHTADPSEVVEGAESFQSLSARLSRVLGAAVTSTLDVAVDACLEELGRFAAVDVAFVTLVDDDDRVSHDWHWIRPGRVARAPDVGSPIAATFGSATEFLRLGHTIAVDDLFQVDLAPSERALATANGLRAIAMAPVLVGANLLGLVGLQMFDNPHDWHASTLVHLEVVAQLLVQAVTRTQERGALALANARARRIAEYIPDGLLLLDTAGVIVWSSPSFLRMSGLDEADLIGRRAETVFLPSHHAALDEHVRAVAVHQESFLSAQMRDRHGNWRWADLALRLASDPGSRVPDEIVMTVRDSHERHLHEARLARRGDLDPLTGLLNRAALDRAVEELPAADVLVAFCDVDDFKTINDDRGHRAGDEVLRGVASALRDAIRADDLIARIGGDEFVIVVAARSADSDDEANALGARLVRSVHGLGGDGTTVSLSVGVSGPSRSGIVASLLEQADRAMYQAKRSGKNRYVYLQSV